MTTWDRTNKLELEIALLRAELSRVKAVASVEELVTGAERSARREATSLHDRCRMLVRQVESLTDRVEELEVELAIERELTVAAVGERDRARSTAVRLEQELAHLEEQAHG